MAHLTIYDPPFAGLAGREPEKLFDTIPTPCYVMDEARLKANAQCLGDLARRTGCRVLLAQKAFSNYDFYPLLAEDLAGTEASGLYEARLGREQMADREVHVFCGAYREDEFDELLAYADHIVFNSIHQLKKFGPKGKKCGKSLGLRINPECSTQEGHAIYDPCAPGSRMGVTRAVWDREMDEETLSLLEGLHFHTLCEQNADALQTTLDAVEERFGDVLPRMQWLNMGGGHHITRPDYDLPLLESCIRHAQQLWDVTVYLEPGEAVALNAGYLVSRVLDICGKRRDPDRHSGRQRRLSYARCAGDAVSAAGIPGQCGKRIGAPLPFGRTHLPGRGCDWRLHICSAFAGGGFGALRRHGDLYYLQEQYL